MVVNNQHEFATRKTPSLTNSMVFIDTKVENYQSLIAGVSAETQVIVLDPHHDGVEQISRVLAESSDVSSLHIVSHGQPGGVQLGATHLSFNTLDKYAQELRIWAQKLVDHANILLYGCDVAVGEQGAAFVHQLSQLTQANVAASTSKTGSAALGGNWNLEVSTSAVTPPLAFDRSVLEAFPSVLAIAIPGFVESTYVNNLPTTPAGFTVDPTTGAMFFADFGDTNGILRQLAADKTFSTVTFDFTPGTSFYPYVATDIQVAGTFVYSVLSNGELMQIDVRTGTASVLTTFPGFGVETGLAINGTKIYATDGLGAANELWEYNLATNTTTLKVSGLPSDTFGLEFDPVKNRVYFAVSGSGFFVADLNTGTYQLIAPVPSGVGNFAIDPTGDFLYARIGGTVQRISIVDGATTTLQTGLMNDDKGDLAFGRSSVGTGSSLYVVNGNSILEISGFAPLPNSPTDPSSSNLPPANFNGTNGDDVLPANGMGNQGDDTFAPRLGRDVVNGGAGTDLLVIDYAFNPYSGIMGPPAGIQSFMQQTGPNSFSGFFRAYKDSAGNVDEVNFSNIERFYVVGTNAGDLMFGAAGDDTLLGNGGNDTLNAGAGDDTLNAGAGNWDRVDGGSGNDLLVVDYLKTIAPAPGGFVPQLSNYVIPTELGGYSGSFDIFNPTTGQLNRVEFTNIERFQIEGSNGNDLLMGTLAADILNGNGGDDLIDARAGNDSISGGAGNDDIRAGEGNDTINAGPGNWDQVDGEGGDDLLVIDYLKSIPTSPGGPTANLTNFVFMNELGTYSGSFEVFNFSSGQPNRVNFRNIERFQIEGSTGNDTLLGTLAADILNGNGGDDLIESREGNDTINGGAGNDSINAGEGDDTINAGPGDWDRVDGGNGNDLLIVDYLKHLSIATNTPVPSLFNNLTATNGSYSGSFDLFNTSTGQLNSVRFSNIERFQIEGSAGNDRLMGTVATDTLNAGNGDDLIEAYDGNDSINGGAGNDEVIAGNGDDTITAGSGNRDRVDGGNGSDLLIVDYLSEVTSPPGSPAPRLTSILQSLGSGSYSGSFEMLNPTSGQVNRVEFINIERFQIEGSGGNDSLLGTIATDLLNGGSGDDIIDARDGNDTVNGGAGDDNIKAGSGNDTINAGFGERDRVDGGSGSDLLIVDYLSGVTPVSGGLMPRLNSTIAAIGSSYSGSFEFLNPMSGRINRVEFTNIERFQIEGSGGNDSLIGTVAVDLINGGSGDDIIDARDGNDTVNGGQGNDDIQAGAGNDTVNAGFGSLDRVDGGAGVDVLVVDYLTGVSSVLGGPLPNLTSTIAATGSGVYSGAFEFSNPISPGTNRVEFRNIERFQIEGSSGNDTLFGTLAPDLIQGNAGDDLIEGREGSDTLNGGMGSDTLNGGTGNDTLNAGLGDRDRVDGGTGSDLLIVDYLTSVVISPTGPAPSLFSVATATGGGSYSGSFELFNPSANQINRVEFTSIERFQIEGSNGNDMLVGTAATDTLNGGLGSDTLTGGLGNDVLRLGSDTVTDTVQYARGDGSDTVQQFVRGFGGDRIVFSGIDSIDVRVVGSTTEFRIGDGIQSNTGFGSGTLLVSMSGTTGFTANDLGTNLVSTGQFLFS